MDWGQREQGDWGLRQDGTQKGNGWFGLLPSADGAHAVTSEQSLGFEVNGREVQMPSIVPTMTHQELQDAVAGNPITDTVARKAFDHGLSRLKLGKSPFASPGEEHMLPDNPLQKLQSLGRILQQNDQGFDVQAHQTKQLNSGPFKDVEERHSIWNNIDG